MLSNSYSWRGEREQPLKREGASLRPALPNRRAIAGREEPFDWSLRLCRRTVAGGVRGGTAPQRRRRKGHKTRQGFPLPLPLSSFLSLSFPPPSSPLPSTEDRSSSLFFHPAKVKMKLFRFLLPSLLVCLLVGGEPENCRRDYLRTLEKGEQRNHPNPLSTPTCFGAKG